MHDMHRHGLNRATTSTSNCGDNLFSAICYLVATNFDVHSLRLYVVQYFCNAIMSGDQNTFHCLQQHLVGNTI